MNKIKRLKLKGKQFFIHYSFPLLVLFPAILSLIDIIKIRTGTYDGMRTVNEHFEDSIPFLVVGLLLIIRQYWRLNFREVKMNYTDKDLQHALGKTSMELKWRVEKNRDGFFRAFRVGGDGPWWWGEMITIISDDNTILINSISDPSTSRLD
ncbi:MAG: hypothetical protein C0490_11405 [Marivirga sp.]|nr:hypothetical protein [Marivirga sp.]